MEKNLITFESQLKEFISKIKYILTITSDNDVLEYISNLLIELLKVDWVIFVHLRENVKLTLNYSSIDDRDLVRALLSDDIRKKIFQVYKTGVTSYQDILLPSGFTSFVLPIFEEQKVNMILIASYETAELPREELLDIYKSIAEVISITNELRNCKYSQKSTQENSTQRMSNKSGNLIANNSDNLNFRNDGKNVRGKALYDIEYWLNESQRVARIGYFILDLQNGKWKSSKVLDEIFGITKRFEKSIEEWREIIHPEYREKVIDNLENAVARNENYEMDYIIVRQEDGLERWVRGVGKYDFDKKGNPIRILGTVQDITDRKRSEESQRAYEERFFKFFQQTPYVLGITRLSDDQFIEVNEEFTKFFGYSREEIIGNTTLGLNIWADLHSRFEMFRIINELGSIREFENKIRIKNGEIRDTVMSLQLMVVGGEACIATLIRDVTEEREALADKARLAIIVQSSNDGILSLDNEGLIQMINPAAEILFGYNPGEIIGRHISFIFDDENRDEFLKLIEMLKIHNKYFTVEISCLQKSGTTLEVEISAATILNAQKNITGISIMIRDITKRKQADEALRESEEKYKILFEDSIDPVLIIDGDIFTNANSSAYKIFGYSSKEELLQKHQAEISPKIQPDGISSEEKAKRMMNIAYEHGMTRFEWVYIKKNGTPFTADVALTRFPLNGKYMLHALLRDITEKKRLEFELIGLNRKFLSHIRNMPLGYMEVDKNMIINDWNPFAEEIFGFAKDEVVGQKITELIFTKYTKILMETLIDNLKKGSGGKHSISENVTKINGIIICEWYNTPLFDNMGNITGCASLVKDITEQKQNEKTLQNAKEAAESANAAKSEFIANMSHEIRTPLNAVIGFSELLSSVLLDRKQKSYINSINLAGKSLLTLINDILDLSKIEAGMMHVQYSYVSPVVIFNEIKQIFNQKIEEKKLHLIIEIEESLPKLLYLDEIKIRQILLNLVGNSIKFTENGHIKLSAKKLKKDSNEFNKIDILLSIEDTGIGIPDNEHDKIFESFRQQMGQDARKFGGTGLGLSISRKLVHMMKGKISVNSMVGKGSTFTIELHDIEIDEKAGCLYKNTMPDFKNIKFEKAKILVVDDLEINRILIEEMLILTGLEVIMAENRQNVLEKAIEYKPDIILMDIRMSDMVGIELIKLIKENSQTENIKVLALTSASTRDELNALLTKGFDGYIQKPVSTQRMLGELSKFLKIKELIPRISDNENITNSNALELDFTTVSSDDLKFLDNTIMPSLKKLGGAIKISEVNKLSDEIIKFGIDNGNEYVICQGEYLKELGQRFDIGEIKKLIIVLLKYFEGR